MIKVVLFDFYGVFVPDTYNLWLKTNGLTREGIFAELVNELDRSHITDTDFLDQLSRAIGHEVKSIEIHDRPQQPDTRLVALLHELKQNYRIALFSNASKKLHAKLELLQLTPLFDEIIVSSDIGHAKPSPESFRIVIERLGVESSEIFFIDDNPRNIEAAKEKGISAVQFTSFESLLETLKKYGVV